jgi:hypothetical protein
MKASKALVWKYIGVPCFVFLWRLAAVVLRPLDHIACIKIRPGRGVHLVGPLVGGSGSGLSI